MEIEVLLSAMHLNDLSIVEQCNITTPCLIVNQTDKIDYIEDNREYGIVRMFSTIERGLSKSRNMALKECKGDICVICDDDVKYKDDYKEIISRAYKELPDADVIVFNINSLNPDIRPQEDFFKKVKRIPKYKTYSSVHITFRRESILSKNISFDERFGAGSNLYSMGEDFLFFTQIHKMGLKAYTYPAIIADLSSETSTWFCGYNEKYFYDVGAGLSAAYSFKKHLYKLYYPIRFRGITELSSREIINLINKGIIGYKKDEPFK